MHENQDTNRSELSGSIAVVLGNAVTMYFKAHGHHWNVKGRDFAEFHDFFQEIYEDVYGSVDPLAELMLKMGSNAPYKLQDFISLNQTQDMEVGNDPMLMLQDLYAANDVLIAVIGQAIEVATSYNEQGVLNFLAERDDMHKKWRWQISAYLAPTDSGMPGKSEAAELFDAGDIPVVEQLMDDADGCPLCGAAGCVCPGIDEGYCLCDSDCMCTQCLSAEEYGQYSSQDTYTAFQEQQVEALQAAGVIVAEEQDLAAALLEIAEKYGKFNEDRTGIWAGYTPPAENDVKDIGVKCINCVLYEGPGVCKIIAQPIEDDGKCRFAVIPDGVVKVEDDQIVAAGSKPAPKKDRIYGSKKNKPGSAAGAKKIVFSDKVENSLRNKVEDHNKNAKPGRKATLPMLKAVYRRGAGAFSSSHRPGMTRDGWAMARVNAFLKLLKSGRPANPNYKQDNDLLPKAHPKSSRGEAAVLQHELLQVALKSADEYGSPEHAIFSMAEYSGMGYEMIPALRGAWLRGVRDGDVPFSRAYELATKLYESKDADLLPKKKRKATGE
jgi:starvation-inducible DNA-binding protein